MFQNPEDSLALQIAPTIKHQARAIFSLLQRYNWTQFSVVTTRAPGHQELVGTLKGFARYSQERARVTVAQNGKNKSALQDIIIIIIIFPTSRQTRQDTIDLPTRLQ
nr:hypothetical protein BaRGS_008608 [Batillaria attramentaria]